MAETDTNASGKRRVKGKRKSDIMDKIGQTVRNRYGKLERQLLEMDEHDIEEEDRAGWADAHCR